MSNHSGVVLGEVTNLCLMSPLHCASVEIEALFREIRVARQQRLQHGCLALAVASDQADFFAAHDGAGKAIDHNLIAIGLAYAFEFQCVLAGWTHLIETDVGALYVGSRKVVGLQPLYFLFTARYLAGTRTGREARD